MKTGFKIALPILVFLVGAGLGEAHKSHRLHKRRLVAQATAQAAARELSEKDAKAAEACLERGGMPIYAIAERLAGCYEPKKQPKK